MDSKGYKYKNIILYIRIIAPLVSGKKVGKRINKREFIPYDDTIYDNKIDYIGMINPNKIVDCL